MAAHTHDHGQHHGHDHEHRSGDRPSVLADRVPAFTGLIGGAIFIVAVLFSVVKLTNAKYAGHGEAKAGAVEATK